MSEFERRKRSKEAGMENMASRVPYIEKRSITGFTNSRCSNMLKSKACFYAFQTLVS